MTAENETQAQQQPFLAWVRREAEKAGATPEVLALIDKAAVHIQGCQDVRDAAQNDTVVANDARDAAQAALVHVTNRHAECDAMLAMMRQHALKSAMIDGERVFRHGEPVGDAEFWPAADELNQLVKAHRIITQDNAAWQGRYDRFILAVREYKDRVGFPDGVALPQGFKEALGYP